MRILAIGSEKSHVNWANQDAALTAESKRVWRLYKQGILREIYFTPDQSEAILMLECADERRARRVLASLPLVKRGLISFEIRVLAPYTGYERLFASAAK